MFLTAVLRQWIVLGFQVAFIEYRKSPLDSCVCASTGTPVADRLFADRLVADRLVAVRLVADKCTSHACLFHAISRTFGE